MAKKQIDTFLDYDDTEELSIPSRGNEQNNIPNLSDKPSIFELTKYLSQVITDYHQDKMTQLKIRDHISHIRKKKEFVALLKTKVKECNGRMSFVHFSSFVHTKCSYAELILNQK